MNKQYVDHDPEADALYVYLLDDSTPVASTKSLDDARMIDYSADGQVVGIEFLNVSAGVDLSDLPFGRTIDELLGESGLSFKVFA